MKRNYLLLFCFFMAARCIAQVDSISQRVFLIGDAGGRQHTPGCGLVKEKCKLG
jgi:hypothetical protein